MDWLLQIRSFDIVVVIILLLLTARGMWTGFIRQIASIVAMVLAFVITARQHESFYHFILPFLSNPQVAFIISYVILFGAIYLAVLLLGLGLKKVIDIVLLSWFDRTLGGLLGAAKGVFLSVLIFMVLASVMSGSNNFLRKSFSYPYLAVCSEYILQFIKDANLRSRFYPKEPAIIDQGPAGTDKRATERPQDTEKKKRPAGQI